MVTSEDTYVCMVSACCSRQCFKCLVGTASIYLSTYVGKVSIGADIKVHNFRKYRIENTEETINPWQDLARAHRFSLPGVYCTYVVPSPILTGMFTWIQDWHTFLPRKAGVHPIPRSISHFFASQLASVAVHAVRLILCTCLGTI